MMRRLTETREQELSELKVDMRIWAAACGSGGDDPMVDELGDAVQEILDGLAFERVRAETAEIKLREALEALQKVMPWVDDWCSESWTDCQPARDILHREFGDKQSE